MKNCPSGHRPLGANGTGEIGVVCGCGWSARSVDVWENRSGKMIEKEDYKVVLGFSDADLSEKVTAFINSGYELVGSVFVSIHPNAGYSFCQAVVKTHKTRGRGRNER